MKTMCAQYSFVSVYCEGALFLSFYLSLAFALTSESLLPLQLDNDAVIFRATISQKHQWAFEVSVLTTN